MPVSIIEPEDQGAEQNDWKNQVCQDDFLQSLVRAFERPVKQHLVVCYSFMHSDVV